MSIRVMLTLLRVQNSSSLAKFALVLSTLLSFWKLSVFESLLGILEAFVRSVSPLQLKCPAMYASAATVVCNVV